MSKEAAAAPKAKPKKKLKMRSELYDMTGSVAKLKNRKCPRCGSVMAFHAKTGQRWVCGSCSFTDYSTK